jgi:hypothetical protein
MSASRPRLSPLRALAERLEDYRVNEDARLIAAVILETARELDWGQDPSVGTWLAQLALELAQTSPIRKGQVPRAVRRCCAE